MSDRTPVPGSRRHLVGRWIRRGLLLIAAVVAALCVAFFSVDLGPAARESAELQGTNYLERPMHIGKLKALIWPGYYELDDVVIDGLSASDQPFLTARRIVVHLTWRTLIYKELFVDVAMNDWRMAIETWPGHRSSLPRFPKTQSTGPKLVTTTVRVSAAGGEFTFRDHGTPWSVVAPNLTFNLARAESLHAYVGTAHFDHGVVQIQQFLPMSTSLTTRFTLDGPLVRLHHIDLITDGARSSITGEVNLGERWPESIYRVDSHVDFSRLRELFFTNEPWRVAGDGHFVGTFHLPHDGGHELKGQFSSDLATLDTPGRRLMFPQLHGSLLWLPDRFTVTNAGADFYGGATMFSYTLMPLGGQAAPNARFVADYQGVDLQTFSRAIQWQQIDVRGRASGHNDMRWVNGRLSQTQASDGHLTVSPPEGTSLAAATLRVSQPVVPPEPVPFLKDRPLGPLPIGGELDYHVEPAGIDLGNSWVSSPSTYIAFRGRADFGANSHVPFHVTSTDWQESDRLLAAILTAAGAPSGAVPVGGFGQFDGEMTESFSRPRVEGRFAGEHVRSWDVTWGRVVGDIVIENQYVLVKDGTIAGASDQSMLVDGRFSLGARKPEESRDEMKGVHVRVAHWPLEDFREAFDLTEWPVEGVVESADIRLDGPYHGPTGVGALRIDRGTAWSETFDTVSGDLTFNGSGLQITHIVMAKNVGRVTGSAVLKWDGTYAFDASGDKIPVESLTSFTIPSAPLSGVLHFTASGEGALASPTYEFRANIPDLSAGNQGIGAVLGVLQVRNRTLFIQQLEAHSVLLQLFGTGSIALNEAYDATLDFRFANSRLDPYLPLLAPKLASQLSQYTRAVVGGKVQIRGELKNPAALSVFGTIQDADLTLFDYKLTNDGDILLKFENDVASITSLRLVGPDTSLTIKGDIPRSEAPLSLTANGRTNLAILQLIFPNLESSGAATVNATFGGTPQSVSMSGQATITDGRLRYRSFPHGLEQINGPITFNADRINVDEVRARMADGDVTFSGAIELKGLVPDQFDIKAQGRSMGLRYPTGFRSTVNASLTLTGPVASPTLGGEVDVLRSTFLGEIENEEALLGLGGLGTPLPADIGPPVESTTPMKLDIRVIAPLGHLRIDTANAQVWGSANLDVGGTIDAPSIIGSVSIEHGYLVLNGNRYIFQPSTIGFSDASKMVPVFDFTLTTRARVPAETYEVTFHVTGPPNKLDFTLTSDPPLPTYDLLSLLLGERPDVGTAELRAVQSPQLSQQEAMRTLMAQLMTMPISAKIGSVVQRTLPLDTFSIVPLLGNEAALQALSPGVRVTVGQRISERVFLTYSHALNATEQYDIILVEYEQSERVSWVLSRNEDRTFALDFRIRHVF